MKQKNLVKKAVFPALVALLCSVIALTSVSYAWFTLGDKASVSGMELEVTSAGGLQISASGSEGTFKSDLLLSDLNKEELGYKLPTAAVYPVSTDGTVKEGEMTLYKGTIENGELSKASLSTADFICFDIYVRVIPGKTLQLDEGSVVKMAENQTKETHLSARVAFFYMGYAKTASGAQALTLDNSAPKVIWEPNALIRSKAVKDSGNQSDGTKVNYKGIASVTGTTPTLSTNFVTTIAPNQNTDLTTSVAQNLFELQEGFNRIRVYIWLEGQDIDCVNEVSGGIFAVALKFKQIDTTPKQ